MAYQRRFPSLCSLLVTGCALCWCQVARAEFVIPIETVNNYGKQVHAQANFAFSDGIVTVTLRNLMANPSAIDQNLSGIQFHIRGLKSPLDLFSSSALERNVMSKGFYADAGLSSSGWANSSVPGSAFLSALNTDAFGSMRATHTLIGDPGANDLYASANASIAGNGPYNWFLAGTLTFVMTNSLLNGNSAIDGSVLFRFGADGNNQFEVPTGPGPAVPAPPTAILAGVGGLSFGLSGLLGWKRHRHVVTI